MPRQGLERGGRISMHVDGKLVEAYEGESVAAAVMADRGLELRETEDHEPRGCFCGIGVCYDCVMVVDGVPNTRTCISWVHDGMIIERQLGSASAVSAIESGTH